MRNGRAESTVSVPSEQDPTLLAPAEFDEEDFLAEFESAWDEDYRRA